MWREFVNLVMNFFFTVTKLTWDCGNPNIPPPPPTFALDAGYSAESITTADGQSNNRRPHYHPPTNVQWLIGVCVAIVGITIQALQTYELRNSPSFHWICMALVFSLIAVLVSIYTAGDYEQVSRLVVHAGIFSVFTALVVAIVINIQLPFKVISVAVFLIGILIIIWANLCKLKP